APTSRDVVDFGSPVDSASSPTLVGSSLSTTRTSSWAARSIDWVPVCITPRYGTPIPHRDYETASGPASSRGRGLQKVSHPLERPRQVLARVRVRDAQVVRTNLAECGAGQHRHPGLVEQALRELVGVEARA